MANKDPSTLERKWERVESNYFTFQRQDGFRLYPNQLPFGNISFNLMRFLVTGLILANYLLVIIYFYEPTKNISDVISLAFLYGYVGYKTMLVIVGLLGVWAPHFMYLLFYIVTNILMIFLLMGGMNNWWGILPLTCNIYAMVLLFMMWKVAGSPERFKYLTFWPVKVCLQLI